MKPGALRYVFSEKIRNTKSVAEMNNWIGPNLAEIQDKNMFHCSTQTGRTILLLKEDCKT